MEANSNLHSINALKSMEVIDINSGAKIGFIKDIKIDYDNKKVLSIIIPGENRGWFSKTEDIEINWESIVKLGVDVIIVDSKELQLNINECDS
ncbi:YlmC/YmxH family sporulation protein [Clostridium sp. HCP1S3_B4]|uniref:YlmC/YmxH family sporulation protein n=1 Tax=unclassified Clostridium TaxID=2614128 RepID=UPI0016948A92|nr:YlmC/YmxH family sporulation protein [Clostridiales bacterium]MDY2730569.1 YlmC/YmxH family sporulation protein [Clostridium sp.]NLK23671.1 YlmC/YmxH family sporulation protein [Clostridiales bacterium]